MSGSRAGDEVTVLGAPFSVIEVPGHTAGHIAYYSAAFDPPVLFCGDTLFACGCGRLFEGTPAQMLDSLDRLSALPAATRVYCAHEYTLANIRFALAVEPGNADLQRRAVDATALRARGEPTIPSTIALELATNPFMRSDVPAIQAAARARAGAAGGNRSLGDVHHDPGLEERFPLARSFDLSLRGPFPTLRLASPPSRNMRIALRLLPAVLACGFAAASASETAPGASDGRSPAAAAPAAGVAAPSAMEASDIPLDVILEYMPELAPADGATTQRTPLVAAPSIDLWQRIRAGFRMPDLETRLADQRTRWYASRSTTSRA